MEDLDGPLLADLHAIAAATALTRPDRVSQVVYEFQHAVGAGPDAGAAAHASLWVHHDAVARV